MAKYNKRYGVEIPTKIIHIMDTEAEENYTVYIVKVTLEKYSWTIRHRYSHFVELNDQLVQVWNLDKSLLPGKKLFGNQNDKFVLKRKHDLEIYLQTAVRLLPFVPPPLAAFLDFPTYEMHGILKSLASDLFLRGMLRNSVISSDAILSSSDCFLLSPLHLYALVERLKLPEPPCESGDKSQDLSHILDFLSKVERVVIVGSKVPVGTSNLVPNQLSFDMLRFKNLHNLKLQGCCCSGIGGLEVIRKTVKILEIHTSITTIKEFLLCDVVHSDSSELSRRLQWPKLKKADFRYNDLTAIDESIKLLRRVEEVDLSHNHISEIQYLASLPALSSLDLSYNHFSELEDLHTKLGNIVTLNLADNAIERLHGFAKLYSLGTLDLTSNKLSRISEIEHLVGLPCLESLSLVANPVTIAIDYRTRVLELFDKRAAEICLDNECSSKKELDTVAVRIALRKARQRPAPQVSQPHSSSSMDSHDSEPRNSYGTSAIGTSIS